VQAKSSLLLVLQMNDMNMMKYTLAFDVYGTLIDTTGVFHLLESMVGKEAESLMDTWRNKQLEYSFRRGLMDQYVDFSICTEDALTFSCLVHKVPLRIEQKKELMAEYSILPIFPDVLAALGALEADGHQIFAFSNGSYEALDKLLTNAKIMHLFDGIVSVEDVGTFKPNPRVYEHFNGKTESTKSDSWLISSNPFDVIGGVAYGMRAVWVQRNPEVIFDPWDVEPTIQIQHLTELSSILPTS